LDNNLSSQLEEFAVALKSDNIEVRRQAIISLAKIGGENAINIIITALNDEENSSQLRKTNAVLNGLNRAH